MEKKLYNEAFQAYRTKDYDRALRLLSIFAEQGDPAAQTALGTIYELGLGKVPIDLKEAEKWYRLASAQGEGVASNNLGTIASSQNRKREAAQWYTKARRQGFSHSPQTATSSKR